MYRQQQDPAKIDALKAEAQRLQNLSEIRCAGDLHRLGIKKGPGKLSVYDLDRRLAERGVHVGERIRIKADLAAIGWLD